MQKIPFTKQEIKQLKLQNELHFKSNLKQLFAMIPKGESDEKKKRNNV
ncbi:hypothetical protein ES705_09375 [subsurface metagenome]